MLSIEFYDQSQPQKMSFDKLHHTILTSSYNLKKDKGFIQMYYEVLKFFKSQENAFMYLNIIHFKRYNSFKFCSFKEFREFKNKNLVEVV